MRKQWESGHDLSVHYDDLNSLLEDKPEARNPRVEDLNGYIPSWWGRNVSSHDQFMEKVNLGWPELVQDVKAKAGEIAAKPDRLPPAMLNVTKRRRVRSDAGSDLDIHAVYQGQLDRAWSTTRHEIAHTRRRAAHVYVEIGGLGERSAPDSAWRAVAAYRVCDLLQRSGYTVDITVGATAGNVLADNRTARVHTSFTAKSSRMPLDLGRLAMQATLGWHRTHNFHARCCIKGHRVSHGMGYTISCPKPPYILEREAAGELIISIHNDIYSREQAIGHINRAVKVIGDHMGIPT